MTTVLITSRVADYAAWRPEYDRAMGDEWTKDIRAYQVWRGQDDQDLVVVAHTFDTRELAEAFTGNPTLREAMGRAGVDESSVRIDFVDEVASGHR